MRVAAAHPDVLGVVQESLGESLWPVPCRRSNRLLAMSPAGLNGYEGTVSTTPLGAASAHQLSIVSPDHDSGAQ